MANHLVYNGNMSKFLIFLFYVGTIFSMDDKQPDLELGKKINGVEIPPTFLAADNKKIVGIAQKIETIPGHVIDVNLLTVLLQKIGLTLEEYSKITSCDITNTQRNNKINSCIMLLGLITSIVAIVISVK